MSAACGQPLDDQSARADVAPSELADGSSSPANSNPPSNGTALEGPEMLDEASASLPHPTRQCASVMLR
jgi:hypothetical protein